MKQRSILALMTAALMLTPAIAQAARGDGGYKPAQEKAGKKNKKGKKANNRNTTKHKTQGKTSKRHNQGKATQKQTRKQAARPPVNSHAVRAHHHKKKKARKFKRLIKKSLRAFENYGYLLKQPHHRARHNPYRHRDRAVRCMPKHVMRARLVHRGWHDFELINRRPNRIRLEATNYKGRRFRLVLDRCTGHIIKKRPLPRYWSRY